MVLENGGNFRIEDGTCRTEWYPPVEGDDEYQEYIDDWHTLVVTHTGTYMKAYIDGEWTGEIWDFSSKTDLTETGKDSSAITAKLYIGNCPEGGRGLVTKACQGYYRNFAIYNRALTNSEVINLGFN